MKEVTTQQRRRTALRIHILRAQLRKVEQLFTRLAKKHELWKAENLK